MYRVMVWAGLGVHSGGKSPSCPSLASFASPLGAGLGHRSCTLGRSLAEARPRHRSRKWGRSPCSRARDSRKFTQGTAWMPWPQRQQTHACRPPLLAQVRVALAA